MDVNVQTIIWTLKHMAKVFTCLHPDRLTISEEEVMGKSLIYALPGGWLKDAEFLPSFPRYPHRSFDQMVHIYTQYPVFQNRHTQEEEIQERRAVSKKKKTLPKFFSSFDCQNMLDVTTEKKKSSSKHSALGYHNEPVQKKRKIVSEGHGVGVMSKEDKSPKVSEGHGICDTSKENKLTKWLPPEPQTHDSFQGDALVVVKEDPEGTLQKIIDCDPQPPGLELQLIPKPQQQDREFWSVLPRVGRDYKEFCVHTKPLRSVAKSKSPGLAYPVIPMP